MPRRKIWTMLKKEKIHAKGHERKKDKCPKNKTMGT
jgi:hypothetical protein